MARRYYKTKTIHVPGPLPDDEEPQYSDTLDGRIAEAVQAMLTELGDGVTLVDVHLTVVPRYNFSGAIMVVGVLAEQIKAMTWDDVSGAGR